MTGSQSYRWRRFQRWQPISLAAVDKVHGNWCWGAGPRWCRLAGRGGATGGGAAPPDHLHIHGEARGANGETTSQGGQAIHRRQRQDRDKGKEKTYTTAAVGVPPTRSAGPSQTGTLRPTMPDPATPPRGTPGPATTAGSGQRPTPSSHGARRRGSLRPPPRRPLPSPFVFIVILEGNKRVELQGRTAASRTARGGVRPTRKRARRCPASARQSAHRTSKPAEPQLAGEGAGGSGRRRGVAWSRAVSVLARDTLDAHGAG